MLGNGYFVAVSAQIFHHLTWAKGALAYIPAFYPLRLRYSQIKPWVSTPFWSSFRKMALYILLKLFSGNKICLLRVWLRFSIKTTSGYDAMHMGMKIELLSPGM
jgi:hypothetical protein